MDGCTTVCESLSADTSAGLLILESVSCEAPSAGVSDLFKLESVSSVLAESLGFGTGGGLRRLVEGFGLSLDWVTALLEASCAVLLSAVFSD